VLHARPERANKLVHDMNWIGTMTGSFAAMARGFALGAALLSAWGAQAADPPGTVTILEGEALIYRGLGRAYAAPGVRLALGDIVETGQTTFMQIEMPDRTVVQFGPMTRALINSSGTQSTPKPDRWLFVMNGWCKIAGPKAGSDKLTGIDIRSKVFDIPANNGVVVFQMTPAESTLFVERGEIRLAERQANGPSIVVPLKADDYYRRKPGSRGEVNPAGTQTFVAAIPRAFRDSLPPRLDRYRDDDVRPKEAPDFVYADVEPWLKAEPWLRRPFVQRWRSKARDPAFRSALIANLSAHTEWDPILFPEKYIKKEVVKRPAPPPAPPPAPVRSSSDNASSPSTQ
jgi:hypothetical protein